MDLSRYWSQPPDHLLAQLRSLSTTEARQRLAQFGPNSLKGKPKLTALTTFLNQFKSPLVPGDLYYDEKYRDWNRGGYFAGSRGSGFLRLSARSQQLRLPDPDEGKISREVFLFAVKTIQYRPVTIERVEDVK